jgi:hypothetical protein
MLILALGGGVALSAACVLYNDAREFSRTEFAFYAESTLDVGDSTPEDVLAALKNPRLQKRADHEGVGFSELLQAREFVHFSGVFPDRRDELIERIPADGFGIVAHVANGGDTLRISFCTDDYYMFFVFDAGKRLQGWFAEAEWTCL